METAFNNLYGNDRLKSRLADDFRKKTLSHAYIIEGKKGTGKHTLADIIAAGIGCISATVPCGDCESCRKIFSHIAADISYIELSNEKRSIGVENIRNLHTAAFMKPTELDYKFFIIAFLLFLIIGIVSVGGISYYFIKHFWYAAIVASSPI